MIEKDDPVVLKMRDWVDEEYADGRTTSMGNDELEAKVAELTNGKGF